MKWNCYHTCFLRGLIVCESGLGLAYETGVPRLSSFRAGYHADKAYAARGGRVFETFDAAVAQNRKEMAKTERTARNIVQRHVERHEDGYRITHDERQKTRGFGRNQTNRQLSAHLMC